MKPLSERLRDWTDIDLAEFHLGVVLGLFEDGEESFRENKATFWAVNDTGQTLHSMILAMTKTGLLEYNVEDLRIRWRENP